MKGKVTEQMLSEMKKCREQGDTYNTIALKFKIGRITAMKYLRSVQVDTPVSEKIWKKAQDKTQEILEQKGFKEIIDLNQISPASHFDWLAKKGKEWWLFDSTINESKDLAEKSIRLVPKFRCAIIYLSHDLKNHWVVELKKVKW